MIQEKDLPKKTTTNFLHTKNNFCGHKASSYVFENVKLKTLDGLSLFVDHENNVVKETLDEHILWRPKFISPLNLAEVEKRKKYFTEFKMDDGCFQEALEVSEGIDLTHSFGHYVFGHMFDSFQRLYEVRDIAQNRNIKFLVSSYDRIVDFLKHLSILIERPVKEEDLIVTRNYQVINIKKLYHCTQATFPADIRRDCYLWIVNKYFGYFKIADPQPKYQLYLDRNHIRTNSRGVLNNKSVIEELKKENFIIIDGRESLEKLVYYFSNARTVVGCHGSLFTLTTFCNKDTKIIEFCPNNRISKNFLHQFKMAQDFRQLIVEGDDNFNIEIDVEKLRHLLKEGTPKA